MCVIYTIFCLLPTRRPPQPTIRKQPTKLSCLICMNYSSHFFITMVLFPCYFFSRHTRTKARTLHSVFLTFLPFLSFPGLNSELCNLKYSSSPPTLFLEYIHSHNFSFLPFLLHFHSISLQPFIARPFPESNAGALSLTFHNLQSLLRLEWEVNS